MASVDRCPPPRGTCGHGTVHTKGKKTTIHNEASPLVPFGNH